MSACLVRHLLASHATGAPGRGEPLRVRADHVLLGEYDGPLAFLGFETLGLPRVACEEAVVVLERDPAGPDSADDARWLHAAARRWGARLVRAGAGPAAAVYLRRFAAPGRVLVSAEPAASGAGAFGSIVLAGGALEATFALAGLTLPVDPPAVCELRLTDALPTGASAEDLIVLLRERVEARAAGAAIEFTGPGVATLPMAERCALARLVPAALGARLAVFPVDDRTRAWLRARGRETDWRRLETGGTGFDATIEIALADVSPDAAASDTEADALHVGPHADDATLVALADGFAGRTLAAGMRMTVELAGRGQEFAVGAARLAALTAAGVEWRSPVAPGPEGERARGSLLHGGSPGDARACGAPSLVFRARHGRAPRPGELESLPPDDARGAPLDAGEVLEPAVERDREAVPLDRGRHHVAPPRPSAFVGAWRGAVVHRHDSEAGPTALLSWGPRLVALRADADALAAHLLSGGGEEIVARSRAHGGGVVVAGRDVAAYEGLDAAPRALAAAGVRVLIAVSFAPGARRRFAQHGVLPLTWRRADDAQTVAVGDVLELAGLPESLQPGEGVELRDLTTGWRLDLEHGLGVADLETLAAGGWLRWAAHAAHAAEV